MSKLGKQFELVVSDVVKEMDRDAKVHQGEWVEGPDGERELDVIIEGMVEGKARRIQIECRDYNPEGRPIGIGHIDGLESKHRDLQMDVSLLCSNAGFTADAIRKAKRVGIGLIGVLRENDPRIRYRVVDEIYIRRVNIVQDSGKFDFAFEKERRPHELPRVEEITFKGIPVHNWLVHRVQLFLSLNPVVKGAYSLNFRFKTPLDLALPSGTARTKSIRVRFELAGGWIAQRIEIDATSGLYNWIRQTVHLGPGKATVTYKDVKFGVGGTPIAGPPQFEPNKSLPLVIGEMSISILDLGGLDVPKQIPQLDQYVLAEDLELVRRDLPRESYFS